MLPHRSEKNLHSDAEASGYSKIGKSSFDKLPYDLEVKILQSDAEASGYSLTNRNDNVTVYNLICFDFKRF
jgi:hypothetical protein